MDGNRSQQKMSATDPRIKVISEDHESAGRINFEARTDCKFNPWDVGEIVGNPSFSIFISNCLRDSYPDVVMRLVVYDFVEPTNIFDPDYKGRIQYNV